MSIDWTKSMQQTFEYWKVDPNTWGDKEKIDLIKSSSIDWDSTASTLGSASFSIDQNLNEECYIRTYLIATQNGSSEKFPLGTHLVQTPSVTFDGKVQSVSLDAYTPLIELKDSMPPIGYTLLKGIEITDIARKLMIEHVRAPISKNVNAASTNKNLLTNFVASTDDTWLTYITDLLSQANYSFGLEPDGTILFMPDQDFSSLQPVFTFNDDNSSILYADIDIKRDLYGVPNVVEVVYQSSSGSASQTLYSRVENNSTSSPISTVNRGREIVYRDTSPNFSGYINQSLLDNYAKQLLKNKSSLEYTVTYSHGYTPKVRVGDCVRLNYTRAGLSNVKARVVAQSIDCSTGCKVSETATYTESLWEG